MVQWQSLNWGKVLWTPQPGRVVPGAQNERGNMEKVLNASVLFCCSRREASLKNR